MVETSNYAGRFDAGFFAGDPLDVAPALLGAVLVHRHPDRGAIAGRIIEVEAYRGEEDQACHARVGRTRRTSTMYGPPGRAYVYLIYGMYHMLNVVTWPEGQPSAVLIRGIEPITGIDRTSDGPGKLTRALGVDMGHNGVDLRGTELFLVPGGLRPGETLATSRRIGVDYAGEWAERPWRFMIAG